MKADPGQRWGPERFGRGSCRGARLVGKHGAGGQIFRAGSADSIGCGTTVGDSRLHDRRWPWRCRRSGWIWTSISDLWPHGRACWAMVPSIRRCLVSVQPAGFDRRRGTAISRSTPRVSTFAGVRLAASSSAPFSSIRLAGRLLASYAVRGAADDPAATRCGLRPAPLPIVAADTCRMSRRNSRRIGGLIPNVRAGDAPLSLRRASVAAFPMSDAPAHLVAFLPGDIGPGSHRRAAPPCCG